MNTLTKQIIILGGILVISGGLIFLLALAGRNQTDATLDALDEIPGERTIGTADMPLTLVEYSDFECPACTAYVPLVKQVLKDFDSKIRFVYRYFPLSQIHPNARLSAQAAQAAAMQGKFWEMHDILFAEQTVWAKSNDAEKLMYNYATQLGLDMERFKKDINSDQTKEIVTSDYDRGIRAGVKGTPTFFLNGKSINNPRDYDGFKAIIQTELNSK